MDQAGYLGQIYVNVNTGEVIIANRGTQNLANVKTDGGVALGMVANVQPIADEFAREGLRAAKKVLANAGVKMSALYTTGHSLGGAEAEGQAQMLSAQNGVHALLPADVHITNFSIDAPGISDRAHQGDKSRYTSYNLSAQGDVVHKAGGDQLEGTVQVPLPIGPRIAQTEGMMLAGAATAIELPFVGLPMIAYGADKALEAHRSTLILDQVTGTVLAGIKLTELGTSSAAILAAFKTKPTTPEPVTAQVQTDTKAANDTHAAPVSSDHPNIWGLDPKGNIDPAALKGDSNVVYAEQWLDVNGYRSKARPQYRNA
ncbi:hypothetical protein DWV00_10830 [Trinickia dinghuensis]|uniref:Fungal lipase-like domain-containing protein n=2 Tax=Trinickia dinghuensis TaxID=2291023 RepID=A0A3D8K1P7_9BURK|nr:hypothetical protein DWV00_10830 [Trinickia dinghuensis]